MSRRLRVVTLGSAIQDVFLRSNKFEEIKDTDAPDGVDACVPLGAKIALDDIVFATGGGATNTAVTFARFGYATSAVCRVGHDPVGDGIISQLDAEGVHTRFIQRDPKLRTGYSSVLVAGSGHRAILTYRGASAHVDRKPLAKIPRVDGWYISSLAGDLQTFRTALKVAETHKAQVAWNPGNAELEHGLTALKSLIRRVDLLILNREEAAALTNQPPRALKKILALLSPLPKHALIVTDGAQGAYVFAEGETLFAAPLPAKRINATGAGDAFGSAFAAIFFAGGSAPCALAVAMLNATGVIQKMGAKEGILKELPAGAALKKVKMWEVKT